MLKQLNFDFESVHVCYFDTRSLTNEYHFSSIFECVCASVLVYFCLCVCICMFHCVLCECVCMFQ